MLKAFTLTFTLNNDFIDELYLKDHGHNNKFCLNQFLKDIIGAIRHNQLFKTIFFADIQRKEVPKYLFFLKHGIERRERVSFIPDNFLYMSHNTCGGKARSNSLDVIIVFNVTKILQLIDFNVKVKTSFELTLS